MVKCRRSIKVKEENVQLKLLNVQVKWENIQFNWGKYTFRVTSGQSQLPHVCRLFYVLKTVKTNTSD